MFKFQNLGKLLNIITGSKINKENKQLLQKLKEKVKKLSNQRIMISHHSTNL